MCPNIGIRSRRCRSIGCRFFPIPFSVGTEWNRISNGSKFFIRPIISRSHQILTYICQRLSIKGLKSSVTLRYWQKLYTAMFMSTKAKREWLSFQCTNRLGKTKCLSPILYLVFLKCILFQKKLATNAFIEEFLWKTTPDNMKNFCIVHLSAKDSILNAFTTFESKTCDWRILAGGILKSFSQENRGQNTVRSGIHDIACTGGNLNRLESGKLFICL